jgi:hypothetical protein
VYHQTAGHASPFQLVFAGIRLLLGPDYSGSGNCPGGTCTAVITL